MNRIRTAILMISGSFFTGLPAALAQTTNSKTITVDQLFQLVKENHPSLKSLAMNPVIAAQNIKVAKNQFLPEISANLQASYLGDGRIIDRDFSHSTTVEMPHFGNQFTLEAKQLIWKGNAVKNNIKILGLREEVAALNYEANEQKIKLLTLGYYLDLYQAHNQEKVYQKNMELAAQRLINIRRFYEEGMVTRNDVIRGELQLSHLKLALEVVHNNQQILNKQLVMALGLDAHTTISPDESLSDKVLLLPDLASDQAAIKNHPAVQQTQRVVELQEVSEKIVKSEVLPSLVAFAGNSLQRPITTVSPALDMYANGWTAGLALSFDLDALYKSSRKLGLHQLEREQALYEVREVEQLIDVAVNTAYIKYQEALSQHKTLELNTALTAENYRIMESKYNNQLAILLDLIDASNAKLDTELQFANSEINIIYAYYKIAKEAGRL
ncbi:TolC family protein [Flavobacterium sp. JP2137]|uniref:TolC family protein n=1 Tax=Flavobacterium sp. JP2137 TaxID=3414510 RepID=UPI003D301130